MKGQSWQYQEGHNRRHIEEINASNILLSLSKETRGFARYQISNCQRVLELGANKTTHQENENIGTEICFRNKLVSQSPGA